MPADHAQVNRSLSTIRTELEFLRDAGFLSPPQFASIMAQLPGANGSPSPYMDTKFTNPAHQFDPSLVAQQAQNPNNPAHPQHPEHGAWAKKLAGKFGNAAMFGAGATLGGDLMNDALHHVGL